MVLLIELKGVQLGGFADQFACSLAGVDQEIIVSGGSRGGGEVPSLTDVLVVFYLLFTECSIDHSKGTKFPRREGESKFLGAVGFG